MDDMLQTTALRVCKTLSALSVTLAVAESCSGGALCSALTALPDCGKPFEQGFITYTKESKIRALKVERSAIERYGVISAETARAMARGARKEARTTFGISITGVAGPDTAEGKPVGLVYIACAGPERTMEKCFQFEDSGRDTVRYRSAYQALLLLESMLEILPHSRVTPIK